MAPPDWLALAWAGLLMGGEGAVLGGLSAAHLEDLVTEPNEVFVWTPTRRVVQRTVGSCRLVLRLGFRESRGAPPRSTVEDTLLDASQQLARESDVIAVVARAMQQRRTTQDRLAAAAALRRRLRHRQLLRDLCARPAAGIESVLEWRFIHDVVDVHGLPAPQLQRSLVSGARCDAWFDPFRLIVELDGEQWHRQRTASDRWRDNEHVVAVGVQTLRYGTDDVLGWPCRVAQQLARALQARGWDGGPRPCPRCRVA